MDTQLADFLSGTEREASPGAPTYAVGAVAASQTIDLQFAQIPHNALIYATVPKTRKLTLNVHSLNTGQLIEQICRKRGRN